jgi:hypothetical protein
MRPAVFEWLLAKPEVSEKMPRSGGLFNLF